MPKSKQRKGRKSPYVMQEIRIKQKIHNADGTVSVIDTGRVTKIKHVRHNPIAPVPEDNNQNPYGI